MWWLRISLFVELDWPRSSKQRKDAGVNIRRQSQYLGRRGLSQALMMLCPLRCRTDSICGRGRKRLFQMICSESFPRKCVPAQLISVVFFFFFFFVSATRPRRASCPFLISDASTVSSCCSATNSLSTTPNTGTAWSAVLRWRSARHWCCSSAQGAKPRTRLRAIKISSYCETPFPSQGKRSSRRG